LHETPELLDLFSPSAEQSREEIAFYAGLIDRARGAEAASCRVLELGIGTGRIFFGLPAEGVEFIGLDRSEAFLALCRQRAIREGRAAQFFRGDMRDFSLTPPARVVLCPCGTMNLLLAPEDLRGFFSSVAGAMESGGLFGAELWVSTAPAQNFSGLDSHYSVSDSRSRAVRRLLGAGEEDAPLTAKVSISAVSGQQEPWLFQVKGEIFDQGKLLFSDVETGRLLEPAKLRLIIGETARESGRRAEAALYPCYAGDAFTSDPSQMTRVMLVVQYQ
jgi:SAM-dependent methyltransferase